MNILSRFFFSLRGEKIAGLDIGEDYISCSSFSSKENGKLELEDFGWVKKRPDMGVSATASLIKDLWRKHRIKTHTVCFAPQTPSLLLKYFKHAGLMQDELESALGIEAEQAFQKLKDELYIDWHLYPDMPSDKKGKSASIKEGILVAMPKEVVKKYLLILKMANIYPVVLDVSCMAIANLFLKVKGIGSNNVVCLLNITSHNADFSIISGDSYIYPRNLYSKTALWGEKTPQLIENIKDMLRYYHFKLRRSPVEKLICSGPVCMNEKFQKDLKKSIELPIEFWNPLKDVAIRDKVLTKDIEALGPMMGTCLGLALHTAKDNIR